MKIPSSSPFASALNPSEKGLNHSQLKCSDPVGWPLYTFAIATTAKSASTTISAPSRNCCTRADSSMPRQQIHVISAIQIVEPMRIARVEFSAEFQSKRRNVYVE